MYKCGGRWSGADVWQVPGCITPTPNTTPNERMSIIEALHVRYYEDEEKIISQNDEADCMYFIDQITCR